MTPRLFDLYRNEFVHHQIHEETLNAAKSEFPPRSVKERRAVVEIREVPYRDRFVVVGDEGFVQIACLEIEERVDLRTAIRWIRQRPIRREGVECRAEIAFVPLEIVFVSNRIRCFVDESDLLLVFDEYL